MNFLRELFAYICGQQHCWVLGAQTLPLCQRCTGLYVGAFCGLALILVFRPRPNAFLYWLHGVFLLAMAPFGFHLIEHGAVVRTLTGTLFGVGLAYYLVLNPFTTWQMWKDTSLARAGAYLVIFAVAVISLLSTLALGGTLSAFLITAAAGLGFAALVSAAALNFVILPGILHTLRQRSAVQTA